jgi:hypothetical protein
VLGVFWSVLQPVLAMILFTVIFGHVAKISSGGVPYPLFSYAALVPWFFFANSVQLSSNSLTVNPQLIHEDLLPAHLSRRGADSREPSRLRARLPRPDRDHGLLRRVARRRRSFRPRSVARFRGVGRARIVAGGLERPLP